MQTIKFELQIVKTISMYIYKEREKQVEIYRNEIIGGNN